MYRMSNALMTRVRDAYDQCTRLIRKHISTIARVLLLTHYIEIAVYGLCNLPEDIYDGDVYHIFAYDFLSMSCFVGIYLIVRGKYMQYGVYQLIAYRLVAAMLAGFDHVGNIQSFLLFVGQIGCLLLMLVEWFINQKKDIGADVPDAGTKIERHDYLILACRILVAGLYGMVILAFLSIFHDVVFYICCVPVAINVLMILGGFHAKYAAYFSAGALLLMSFTVLPYYFAGAPLVTIARLLVAVLSVSGGLLLLAHLGAGKLAYDEYKKRE